MGNALIKFVMMFWSKMLATIEAKGKARSKKLKQASHNKSEGKKATGGCGLDPSGSPDWLGNVRVGGGNADRLRNVHATTGNTDQVKSGPEASGNEGLGREL